MAMITVCSKLRTGLIIEHPKQPDIKCTIAGINRSKIIGATYASTRVDQEFWGAWEAENKDFAALKSGALFVVKVQSDEKIAAKDHETVKTGLEPLLKKGDSRTRSTGVSEIN